MEFLSKFKQKLPLLKQYFLERLQEPSTWRGIFLILIALGCNISPEWQEAIITIGLAIVGTLGAVTKG